MALQHEDRERHGAHPPTEREEPCGHQHGDETMERLEMDRGDASGVGFAVTWANVKKRVGVVTIVLSCSGVYWGLKGDLQDERRIVEAIDARVALIERGRSENLPRLEEQVRNNAMQDQRIQNPTEALASLRTMVADLTRVESSQAELIHEAHERQAVLAERLGHVGPHDR